jgi:hypothetical protein
MKFNRLLAALCIASLSLILQACGGGSSGSSSSASLVLTTDKATATGGDVIIATVQLTSSIAGKAVRGVKVRVMSTDPTAISEASGTVNENGQATIQLSTGWVNVDKSVNLVASSDVSSESTSVKITVTAPKLTVTIPAAITPPTFNSNFASIGRTITSNYTLKFVDGNGNPIPNQVISLYIDSLTNKDFNDQIVYTPVQGSEIIAPPGVFTASTDSSGIALVPLYIQMALAQPGPCSTDATTGKFSCTGTALSIMTANWRAVADFAGQRYSTTASSLITFTNTGK